MEALLTYSSTLCKILHNEITISLCKQYDFVEVMAGQFRMSNLDDFVEHVALGITDKEFNRDINEFKEIYDSINKSPIVSYCEGHLCNRPFADYVLTDILFDVICQKCSYSYEAKYRVNELLHLFHKKHSMPEAIKNLMQIFETFRKSYNPLDDDAIISMIRVIGALNRTNVDRVKQAFKEYVTTKPFKQRYHVYCQRHNKDVKKKINLMDAVFVLAESFDCDMRYYNNAAKKLAKYYFSDKEKLNLE